jgi:tRNA 5-methylaminomethyl-2-thiouridine biosynthesis bifunctional protein
MPFTPLQPARLAYAPDSTPISESFNDIYHSADGGPGQAQHVFLHGNGLPERWSGKRHFVILENGFGTGLNFLTTWAAWRADPQRPEKLHYFATELHPFRVEDLASLQRKWKDLDFLADTLRANWPPLLPGFHRLEFAAGKIVLTLMLGEAEASLRKLRASIDAFYLDGFDPQKNPQMWSPALLKRCSQLAAPNATFATWTVAGQVRRAIIEAGFIAEKKPGFGSKREMLAGRIAERPKLAAKPLNQGQREAIIIGAGLAGCAIAERLAVRGWRVSVLDRHPDPASEASGNLAGILRPMLSRDDNLASRLNRACFLYIEQNWRHLDQIGQPPRRNLHGLLQIARDDTHAAIQREWLASNDYPAEFVEFHEADSASQRLGAKVARGGWWFPHAGWASPASLCRAWLSAGGGNIHFTGGVEIASLQRADTEWRVYDVNGKILGQAPVVIFATGAGKLVHTAGLPITPVRGQVSHLAEGSLPKLRYASCSEGYLTPAVNGMHCLGASYLKDRRDHTPSPEEHHDNLQRLARMLPAAAEALEVAEFIGQVDGRVGYRATTPDHLPLVGALPDLEQTLKPGVRCNTFPRHPGLFSLLGLGSRGLVWSALLAEHLACVINQEPLPLPGDQVDAIDPARFALRAYRHME